MTEPAQPPKSTRFLLYYPDGTETEVYYSEPRTLDSVADQIWDKDSPATTVCGISCMCDRADPSDPCKRWAGHDGECTR